jgi:hypothetical protein
MEPTETHPASVTFTVTNRSSVQQTVVLEPTGEIYMLEPGESRRVTYAGDPHPHLSIDLGDGETKIWEEGPGTLTVA